MKCDMCGNLVSPDSPCPICGHISRTVSVRIVKDPLDTVARGLFNDALSY